MITRAGPHLLSWCSAIIEKESFMYTHSRFTLVICMSLTGCLDAAGLDQDPADEPGAVADEPTTGTTEQAVTNSHFDQKHIDGDLFQGPFPPYVTQQFDRAGDCTPGFVRPAQPTVLWAAGAGGWCRFATWNTGDPHDCRAVIVGGRPAFGGDCTSTIQEVMELSGQQGTFSFTAGSTNSATANTTNFAIAVNAGHTLTVTTCGSASGDTYLRLSDVWGTEVAANDDSCGLASRMVYTTSSGGSFTIHAGCWSNGSCSGTVSWSIQ